MRPMLWWGTKKPKAKSKAPKDKSAALRAQALANARAAREAIGQDTLDRVAEAMARRQRGGATRQPRRGRRGRGSRTQRPSAWSRACWTWSRGKT